SEIRSTGITAAEDVDGSGGGNQGKNQVSELAIYKTVVDEQMTVVNLLRCGETSGVPVTGAPMFNVRRRSHKSVDRRGERPASHQKNDTASTQNSDRNASGGR
ncbi:hypothetical protein HK102_005598, partial [Quaeritorhiza haematococci]